MNVYTIGFTKKTAEQFFTLLKASGVKTLIDVRLNNSSQLAGFAKRDDLKYFLKALCDIEYVHEPMLSPSDEILKGFKKQEIDWAEYEVKFNRLLNERKAQEIVPFEMLESSCFLCSEHDASLCHRRLVVEYIADNVDEKITVKHLK